MFQHEIITSEIEILLEKTRQFQRDGEQTRFFDTLVFIKQSRYLAPYNALLVMQQRPDATLVMPEVRWQRVFDRTPKQGVHPLVILKNFGPVDFVYDIKDLADIENYPIPGYQPNLPTEEICRRLFPVEGDIRGIKGLFAEMVRTCRRQGLWFEERPLEVNHAGLVKLKDAYSRVPIKDINAAGRLSNYIMQVNSTHPLEIQFAALVHELAHIYCGHLNEFDNAGFKRKEKDEEEFEAEAVSYLFCYRYGFRPRSEQYLAGYLMEGRELSIASFESIIKAYKKIEDLFEPEEIAESPSRFNVSIGGYNGGSYSLRFEGSSLIYEECGDEYKPLRTIDLKPSSKDWSSFWKSCNKIGIWHWESSYDNPNMVDGTSWQVDIRIFDRGIVSGGSNDSPRSFKAFLNAVKRLAGGLPFA